jgi:hypothetical protein
MNGISCKKMLTVTNIFIQTNIAHARWADGYLILLFLMHVS